MKDLSIRLVLAYDTLLKHFPKLDKHKLNKICHHIINKSYLNRTTLDDCGVSRHEFLLIYKELHGAYPEIFYSNVLSKLAAQRCKTKLNLIERFNAEESGDHAFFDILLAALNYKIVRKVGRMRFYNGGFIKKYNTLPFESIDSCINMRGLIRKISTHCPFCLERSGFHRLVLQEIKSKVKLLTLPFDEVIGELKQKIAEEEERQSLAEYKERQLMFKEDSIARTIRSEERVVRERIRRSDEKRERKRKQREHQDFLQREAAREAREERLRMEEIRVKREEEAWKNKVKNTLARIRTKMLVRSLTALQRAFRLRPKKRNWKRKGREELLDEYILSTGRYKKQIPPDTFINRKGNYILNVEVPRRAAAQARLLVLLQESKENSLMSREDQDANCVDDYTTEALEDLEMERRRRMEPAGYSMGVKKTLKGKKWRFPTLSDNRYENYYRKARVYSKAWSSDDVHNILLYTSSKRDLEIPEDHEEIRKKIEDEIR